MFARGPCAANLRELCFAVYIACASTLRQYLARAVCLREVKLREAKLREKLARGICIILRTLNASDCCVNASKWALNASEWPLDASD